MLIKLVFFLLRQFMFARQFSIASADGAIHDLKARRAGSGDRHRGSEQTEIPRY